MTFAIIMQQRKKQGIAFAIGWFAIVYGTLLVGFSWRLKKHAEVKI